MLLQRMWGHFSGTSEEEVFWTGRKEERRIPSGRHRDRKSDVHVQVVVTTILSLVGR